MFAEDEKLIRDRLAFRFSVPAIRAKMYEQVRVAAGTIIGALNTAVLQWAE